MKKCKHCNNKIDEGNIRCNNCHESYLYGRNSGIDEMKSKLSELKNTFLNLIT